MMAKTKSNEFGIKHDKSSKEQKNLDNVTFTMDTVPEITKEQLIKELKMGFILKFKQLIKDMMNYEDKHDFESKMSTCRYALHVAEDFESKERIEKYTLIFQAIVYAIGWSNDWINDY